MDREDSGGHSDGVHLPLDLRLWTDDRIGEVGRSNELTATPCWDDKAILFVDLFERFKLAVHQVIEVLTEDRNFEDSLSIFSSIASYRVENSTRLTKAIENIYGIDSHLGTDSIDDSSVEKTLGKPRKKMKKH